MKKFFALSAVLMTATVAMAGQPATRVTKMAQRTVAQVPVKEVKAEVMPSVRVDNKFQMVAPAAVTDMVKYDQKKAGAAVDPLYLPDGLFDVGVFYNEEADVFGYSYGGALLLGQAYGSKFVPQTEYSSCAYGDYDASQYGMIDEEGNFTISGFGCNSNYYNPTMTAGRSSYTYGDKGQYNQGQLSTPGYSYFFGSCGDLSESGINNSFGAYEMWTGATFYSGYTNTPAYGSYLVEDEGSTYASDALLIDLGNMYGCMVEKIQFPCVNYDDDAAIAIAETDTLNVLLIDYDPEGVYPTIYYRSTVTGAECFMDQGGWTLANATFTEIDEDGFESEINPIIQHSAQLIISGFYGKYIGIPMVYRNDDASAYQEGGNLVFNTKSYHDYIVDGVQMTDEEGNVNFYGTPYTDAVVNIIGRFTYLGSTQGETEITGYVPEDAEWYTTEDGINYTYVVSAVIDGESYNDFDLDATFGIDTWEANYDDEVVCYYEFDDSYYDSYYVYLVYIAVTDKILETGSTTFSISCNGEANCNINIVSGGTGIKKVANELNGNENAEVYNLQGVKVGNSVEGLAPGVYVRNGQKFVK